MASKRIFTVLFSSILILVSAAAAFAQGAPAGDQKAPRMTIVDPMKDFGTVSKGEKITWSFKIKNTGNADLEISKVQPTCGCTVAEFDKVIKPGQEGAVTAKVDTTNFNGPITKGVTILSNDPDTPTTMVTIKAVVRPYVEAYPVGFLRYSLLQGEAEKKSVVLYSEEQKPLEIVGVQTPGDWVKVDYTKLDKPEDRVKAGLPAQNQYRLDVTVGGPTAPIGPLVDKVKIITNSEHQPEYLLSLSGVVRPAYMVMPTVLNFGDVKPGEPAATRTVVLTSNDREHPQVFKVEKVESSSKLISAEAKAGTQPGRYEVTVKVKDGAKAGTMNEQLKIYTNDLATPVFTLPVTGVIKG